MIERIQMFGNATHVSEVDNTNTISYILFALSFIKIYTKYSNYSKSNVNRFFPCIRLREYLIWYYCGSMTTKHYFPCYTIENQHCVNELVSKISSWSNKTNNILCMCALKTIKLLIPNKSLPILFRVKYIMHDVQFETKRTKIFYFRG